MSRTEEVYLTISIDTECDHDSSWTRSKPLTFNSINKGLPEVLQPAFSSVNAVPTYLLTVEVMEDEESSATLAGLKGDYEYGTHLHAAFIEPEKKFHDYAGVDSPDFQCSYAPDIEYQKLENLTALFEKKFGYRPTSFRAGRYGANGHSLNALERLGYRVDTSATPYLAWEEPNARVDFRKSPEQPFFPKPNTIIEPGPLRSILEVPVTMKPRLLRGPRWFRPWFSSVEQMKNIVRYQLKKHRSERQVVLNMMFHSMEIIPKATPYPQSNEDVLRFVDDMTTVLDWCGGMGVKFCGLSDLYEKYAGADK